MAAKVCTSCGYVGQSKSSAGGNIVLEIFLWCFFIIPGLFYSIWRSSSRKAGCPKCKSKMISADSVVGKRFISEHGIEVKAISFTGENATLSITRMLSIAVGILAVYLIFFYDASPTTHTVTATVSTQPARNLQQDMQEAATVKLAGLNTSDTNGSSLPVILTVTNNMSEQLSAIGGQLEFRSPDNTLLAILSVSTSCSLKASATGFIKTQGTGSNLNALAGKTSGDYSYTWKPKEYHYINGYTMAIK